MKFSKESFNKQLKVLLQAEFATDVKQASCKELYNAVS